MSQAAAAERQPSLISPAKIKGGILPKRMHMTSTLLSRLITSIVAYESKRGAHRDLTALLSTNAPMEPCSDLQGKEEMSDCHVEKRDSLRRTLAKEWEPTLFELGAEWQRAGRRRRLGRSS